MSSCGGSGCVGEIQSFSLAINMFNMGTKRQLMVDDDAKIFELGCRNNRNFNKYKEGRIKIQIVGDNVDKRYSIGFVSVKGEMESFHATIY